MKIAILTDGLHPYVMGGMQRHSTMLIQHLVQAGAEVVFFHTALTVEGIDAAKKLDGMKTDVTSKVEHVFVDYPTRGRFPGHYIRDSFLYSQQLLVSYLRLDQKFDFIYAQGLTGRAFVEAKKNGVNLPLLGINAHGYGMFQSAADLKEKLQHWMLRPTFRNLTIGADYVFSFSGKIREIVEGRIGVPAEKILQLPNAVDASWLKGGFLPSTDQRKFVFLGRYERCKGIEELHAVLKAMVEPGFEFVFIGPIPAAKQLEASWIHYLGSVSDSSKLIALLDGADVLVCPSHAEGMPTVILEAMARGLAIIASDVGATSEVVDSSNGILMPVVNVESLRDAILTMNSISPTKLDSMRCASLERVMDYTWERVSELTLEQIERVVAESRQSLPSSRPY